MPEYNRRALFAAGASAGAAALTGCSLLGDSGPTEMRLVRLVGVNPTETPRTVNVLVTDAAGAPLYWDALKVPAASGDAPGTQRFIGHPTEPGRYRVYARYEGQSRESAAVRDTGGILDAYSGALDAPCVELSPTVAPQATQGVEIAARFPDCDAYTSEGGVAV